MAARFPLLPLPLLIAPEGIEMSCNSFRLSFQRNLLIAPEGIEMPVLKDSPSLA